MNFARDGCQVVVAAVCWLGHDREIRIHDVLPAAVLYEIDHVAARFEAAALRERPEGH